MDYKIVDKESFKVVGKQIPVTTKGGENNRIIPKFWQDCNTDGSSERICKMNETPASTWAIFQSVGPMPHAIQKVWERIFQEWFPATGYEHANAPELEVYPCDDTDSEDYRCEVWIPIIKK